MSKQPVWPDKAQQYYGIVAHWITIVSCMIALFAPVLILLFPDKNLLNPNLLFGAIFEGKNPTEIWAVAGVPFKTGDYWRLFFQNIFTPDGFATLGLVLGCSVTLWALIPAAWSFSRQKEYFYCGVSILVMTLIILAMSGLVSMAG